jgi:hypothetical protein
LESRSPTHLSGRGEKQSQNRRSEVNLG